jgi:hypothetical protein
MYLNKVKARFGELSIVHPDDILPCTEDEISILEEQVGLSLPEAYKEFLLWMGHGAGRLLRGSHCFYEHLVRLQEGARELLEENSFSEILPNDAFVFFMHQGYQFAFFRVSESDDPPIYYYHEAMEQKTFTMTHNCFSEFLAEEIEVHARSIKKCSNT